MTLQTPTTRLTPVRRNNRSLTTSRRFARHEGSSCLYTIRLLCSRHNAVSLWLPPEPNFYHLPQPVDIVFTLPPGSASQLLTLDSSARPLSGSKTCCVAISVSILANKSLANQRREFDFVSLLLPRCRQRVIVCVTGCCVITVNIVPLLFAFRSRCQSVTVGAKLSASHCGRLLCLAIGRFHRVVCLTEPQVSHCPRQLAVYVLLRLLTFEGFFLCVCFIAVLSVSLT